MLVNCSYSRTRCSSKRAKDLSQESISEIKKIARKYKSKCTTSEAGNYMTFCRIEFDVSSLNRQTREEFFEEVLKVLRKEFSKENKKYDREDIENGYTLPKRKGEKFRLARYEFWKEGMSSLNVVDANLDLIHITLQSY